MLRKYKVYSLFYDLQLPKKTNFIPIKVFAPQSLRL
jgi:hypothetical protein